MLRNVYRKNTLGGTRAFYERLHCFPFGLIQFVVHGNPSRPTYYNIFGELYNTRVFTF